MIVIGSVRLNVGMVLIQSKTLASSKCLDVPSGSSVVLPVLRRSGIKRHSVDRHSDRLLLQFGESRIAFRMKGHAESITLGRSCVRTPRPGELTNLMVRNPVGLDHPIPALFRYAHLRGRQRGSSARRCHNILLMAGMSEKVSRQK